MGSVFVKFKNAANNILLIAIAILLITIAIVVVAAISNFRQVNVSAKLVAHTQDVIIQSERILSLLVDNQAASRGYAITGKSDLKDVLKKSKAEIQKQFNNLRILTTDNKEQQPRLDSLLFYLNKRVAFSDTIITEYDRNGSPAALELIARGEGKFYTERAKSCLSNIQAAENILLIARKQINEKNKIKQEGILFSVIIGMLVLLVIFTQKVAQEFKEKKLTAAGLLKQNEQLEEKVSFRTRELSDSKKQLEETFLRITDAFIALDKNWCYTYINKRAAELIRLNAADLIGKNVWEVFPDAVNSSTYHAFHKAMNEQQFVLNEDYYAPLDIWQENHIYPSPEGISVYINEISEKKRAELKIFKVNRLYFFISQVNQMIVRTTDENTLFKEACRIAVELGQFRMAWIGMINEQTRIVQPVMFAGEESGYLSEIKKIIAADVPEGIGPTGKAIREEHYVICNDIATDPIMKLWREAALKRGYLSSMALPIKKFGKVIGAFSFYATERNFFDSAEIALLEEATGDVSFALENFEKEILRKNAADEIKKSNERFEMIAVATNDVIWDWNLLTNEIWWNNNFYKLFGHSKQKLYTHVDAWINGIHPEDRKRVTEGLNAVVNSGKDFWYDEYRHLKSDGSVLFVYDRGFVLHDEQHKPYRMIGSMLDITELKKAEDEITKEKNLSDSIINSLPGVFYLYNKAGKFLRWNRNFEMVSGYSEDEIIHMHPLDFFDTEDKALLTEKIGNVFISGEDNVQANFLSKSKEKMPYYFTGKAIAYHGEICLMGVGIDFSEKIKAQQEIEDAAVKLHQLTAHLQEIREMERKRIGREIHDELGQQLTAIKLDVSWIDKKIPEDFPVLKEKLKNIISLLNGSNQSIRRILSELRPTILDDYGLVEALDWLGKQFTDTTSIPVSFNSNRGLLDLPEPVVMCIFRVYQEALTNITRYANASHVTTILNISNELLVFTVKDDGDGFDTQNAGNRTSFGILGMKERVLSLKGNFTLSSESRKGTTINISIPIKLPVVNS
jgi:PAS domain S-box-containing protein